MLCIFWSNIHKGSDWIIKLQHNHHQPIRGNQILPLNHLWFLISSAPFFKFPILLVLSITSNFLIKSFATFSIHFGQSTLPKNKILEKITIKLLSHLSHLLESSHKCRVDFQRRMEGIQPTSHKWEFPAPTNLLRSCGPEYKVDSDPKTMKY